jgi:hypothetical protein
MDFTALLKMAGGSSSRNPITGLMNMAPPTDAPAGMPPANAPPPTNAPPFTPAGLMGTMQPPPAVNVVAPPNPGMQAAQDQLATSTPVMDAARPSFWQRMGSNYRANAAAPGMSTPAQMSANPWLGLANFGQAAKRRGWF